MFIADVCTYGDRGRVRGREAVEVKPPDKLALLMRDQSEPQAQFDVVNARIQAITPEVQVFFCITITESA